MPFERAYSAEKYHTLTYRKERSLSNTGNISFPKLHLSLHTH